GRDDAPRGALPARAPAPELRAARRPGSRMARPLDERARRVVRARINRPPRATPASRRPLRTAASQRCLATLPRNVGPRRGERLAGRSERACSPRSHPEETMRRTSSWTVIGALALGLGASAPANAQDDYEERVFEEIEVEGEEA